MRPLTKAQAETIHFKRSLVARWSIGRVNRFEYRDLCATASQSPIVLRQSDRVTIRRVPIRGEEILCAFDCYRGTLVTALPRDVVSAEQVHDYIWRRRGE